MSVSVSKLKSYLSQKSKDEKKEDTPVVKEEERIVYEIQQVLPTLNELKSSGLDKTPVEGINGLSFEINTTDEPQEAKKDDTIDYRSLSVPKKGAPRTESITVSLITIDLIRRNKDIIKADDFKLKFYEASELKDILFLLRNNERNGRKLFEFLNSIASFSKDNLPYVDDSTRSNLAKINYMYKKTFGDEYSTDDHLIMIHKDTCYFMNDVIVSQHEEKIKSLFGVTKFNLVQKADIEPITKGVKLVGFINHNDVRSDMIHCFIKSLQTGNLEFNRNLFHMGMIDSEYIKFYEVQYEDDVQFGQKIREIQESLGTSFSNLSKQNEASVPAYYEETVKMFKLFYEQKGGFEELHYRLKQYSKFLQLYADAIALNYSGQTAFLKELNTIKRIFEKTYISDYLENSKDIELKSIDLPYHTSLFTNKKKLIIAKPPSQRNVSMGQLNVALVYNSSFFQTLPSQVGNNSIDPHYHVYLPSWSTNAFLETIYHEAGVSSSLKNIVSVPRHSIGFNSPNFSSYRRLVGTDEEQIKELRKIFASSEGSIVVPSEKDTLNEKYSLIGIPKSQKVVLIAKKRETVSKSDIPFIKIETIRETGFSDVLLDRPDLLLSLVIPVTTAPKDIVSVERTYFPTEVSCYADGKLTNLNVLNDKPL